jgi:hypothetical protein
MTEFSTLVYEVLPGGVSCFMRVQRISRRCNLPAAPASRITMLNVVA